MRHFCTAGPIQADIHYFIPPVERINRAEMFELIDARKYFVLRAPRQTGKTSALLALVDELNATGRYRAMYINVEGAQAARNAPRRTLATHIRTRSVKRCWTARRQTMR